MRNELRRNIAGKRRCFMESCWLIIFKNGNKVILSEKMYKERYLKETPREEVSSEEHWFSMEECIKKNPDIDVIG